MDDESSYDARCDIHNGNDDDEDNETTEMMKMMMMLARRLLPGAAAVAQGLPVAGETSGGRRGWPTRAARLLRGVLRRDRGSTLGPPRCGTGRHLGARLYGGRDGAAVAWRRQGGRRRQQLAVTDGHMTVFDHAFSFFFSRKDLQLSWVGRQKKKGRERAR